MKRGCAATASLLALICGCATTHPYTGFWKGQCSDGFGVQIKPVDGQLYSVSFCGPGGCFEPGTWAPNTTLVGDPAYEIVSPTELRIKHTTYNKCNRDPTWVVASRAPAAVPALSCSLSAAKDSGVVIAWTTDVRETTDLGRRPQSETTVVEAFRPVAVLEGTALHETDGLTIHKGQSFWRALAPTSKPMKLGTADSFLDHMDVDHCVAFGTITGKLPRFTLLTSRPLPGAFREPSKTDQKHFRQLDSSCVDQGDYPEGKAPPCTRPRLLAVTDINADGKPEYWATEPYKWDTGLTVWEDGKRILQVCVGCSD